MITTYTTKCWGYIYRIRADFTRAACQVEMQDEDAKWLPAGFQVADVRHDSAEAMRRVLTQVAIAGGDLSKENERDIERAVSQM